MDLVQPGTPNPFNFFHPSHRLPTELSHLPVDATTTASPPIAGGTSLLFSHERTTRCSVKLLHYTHEAIPYITTSVYFEPKTVHLHLEEISQEIQDVTSNYLVNITIPNTNPLDTADETINYIRSFFQARHYYPGPP